MQRHALIMLIVTSAALLSSCSDATKAKQVVNYQQKAPVMQDKNQWVKINDNAEISWSSIDNKPCLITRSKEENKRINTLTCGFENTTNINTPPTFIVLSNWSDRKMN